MFSSEGETGVGNVGVLTSTNRGHSAGEMAEMALNKIMLVSEGALPVMRDQAIAHRDKLKNVLVFYMEMMAQSERTTIRAQMRQQGHEDLTEIIRRHRAARVRREVA
jgi:hypothetical protein